MKIDKKQPRHWFILLQQGAYTLLAILARPFIRKPEKPIVILYGHQFSGNLKALYLQWQETHSNQLSLYFLSLDLAHSKQLELSGIRVLRCSSLRNMLTLTRCSAMITDHGLHTMTPLIALTDIIFIDVWHGIPFKGFVPGDFRVQHHYDEVWVSSPLLKRIYVEQFGFNPEKVHSLGYARVDKLFWGNPPSDSFKDAYAIPSNNKLVLYAPTWKQDDRGRELFPFGENPASFVQALNDICKANSAILIIRSHINTHIDIENYDSTLYCSMTDFPDSEALLQETDVLICDWSSIAFDFLVLNRPTIFIDVTPPFKNGFSLGKEFRFGRIAGDMTSLMNELGLVLEDPDAYWKLQKSEHRIIAQNIYNNCNDGNAGLKQINHLAELLR